MKTLLFISTIGPLQIILIGLLIVLFIFLKGKSIYTRNFWYPLNCYKRCDRGEYLIFFSIFILFGLLFEEVRNHSINNLNLKSSDLLISTSIHLFSWYLVITAGCRRCHDLGVSGYAQFIPFYFLVMLFKSGEKDSNKYDNELEINKALLDSQKLRNLHHNYDAINNLNQEVSIKNIEVKSTESKQSKQSKFKRLKEFLFLKNGTFKSVLNEGQRRVFLIAIPILSIIIGFIGGWFGGYDDDINYDYFYTWALISPIIIYIALLLFIWVQEGRGNVRSGGNAMGTLWNYIKLLFMLFFISFFIIFALIVAIPYYYMKNTKAIFVEYYNDRKNKNWDDIRDIYADNISVTDIFNGQFEQNYFTKEELINEHKEDSNFVTINNIESNKLFVYGIDHAFDKDGVCEGEIDLTFEDKQTGQIENIFVSTKLFVNDGKINRIERKLLYATILKKGKKNKRK